MAHNELVFAALGGIGEIGMNLSIYGFGDEGVLALVGDSTNAIRDGRSARPYGPRGHG